MLAIAILNWNGKSFMEKFLPSVIQYSNEPGVTIYVIDNGSTDDSIKLLKEQFPQVKIIILEKNYGFSEGYNKGLTQIDTKYYLLLNSDVEVTNNWLSPLVKCIESNSNIAACMPKIKSLESKDQFEYAGAAGGYIDKFGYPFCQGRIFNTVEKDHGQYQNSKSIFWATGACLLIKSDIFHDAGGFDDKFFAHMEEIDLCWRIKNMGFEIRYEPDSVVYHLGGGSLPKTNPRKTYLNFRNNYFMLYKNLKLLVFLKVFTVRFFLDFLAFISFLAKFKLKDAIAIPKAQLTLLLSLNYLVKKKKRFKQKIKKRRHNEIYKRSIVFNFYLHGVKKFSKLNFNLQDT